jgi:hypothetical protein
MNPEEAVQNGSFRFFLYAITRNKKERRKRHEKAKRKNA